MAVQLAIANGATVAGTCSVASMELARLMGVHETFDYADKQYSKYVKPFDVIFDTAGTMNVGRAVSMLKSKGMFVDINPTPGRIIRGMLSRRYKMVFATMGLKHLPEIADLADQDLLRSAIGLQTDFSQAVTTITAFEKGQRTRGRVVLTF
jgi:NADPH:quinone reductase-like Zn-dependent oxidoreductase